MVKRYTGLPFPVYAHVPGKTPHPNKKGGHSFGVPDPLCQAIGESFGDNQCFWFGVDLYNHHFYWEAHVWWEAVWKKSRQKENHDAFLKAVIKLAAGNLKTIMGQSDVALDLWKKARNLLGPGFEMLPKEMIGQRGEWETFFKLLEDSPHRPLPMERRGT